MEPSPLLSPSEEAMSENELMLRLVSRGKERLGSAAIAGLGELRV